MIDVSPTLWGVFFEEINHAGQGGLYSELISNRNFGGVDYAPWMGTGNAQVDLDATYPLNLQNQQSLRLQVPAAGAAGVSNPGFWGLSITAGTSYTTSFYVISTTTTTLTVSLTNQAGRQVYWTQQVSVAGTQMKPDDVLIGPHDIAAQPWKKYTYTFSVNSTDATALFSFNIAAATAGQTVWFDMVSLQSTQGWKGLPYIRADLADRVDALKPAFVRFPGGCYSEGDHLRDRFDWKRALGPIETRPGHHDLWNYFSEDGLGIYEYLNFIEKLGARPIWVVNSGNSHTEQVDTKNIAPWVSDALDSLEFILGAVTTKYGAIRASMGRTAPFTLYAVAIGNEDCGLPYYTTNYGIFYAALTKYYPTIRLIANCDLTNDPNPQPTQLWDYHVYQNPDWFFQHTMEFDGYARDGKKKIFNSEYAVVGGGGQGNLIAAVAEAAWMTGLERNSDLVELASYAPLFVNNNDRHWNPDAIVFNASTSFGTPSYWLQYMFARAQDATHSQGIVYTVWTAQGLLAQSSTVAQVSAGSIYTNATHLLIIKLVNYGNTADKIDIVIPGEQSFTIPSSSVEWRSMTSNDQNDENSFDKPERIKPKDATVAISVTGTNSSYHVPVVLPPFSIHVLRVQLTMK